MPQSWSLAESEKKRNEPDEFVCGVIKKINKGIIMKALHFGAGNIGRGFIGKLLAEAGIEVTFADVNQVLLDALNARGEYPVRIVGEQQYTDIVKGVNAVNSTSDDVITEIAQTELITTAVGPQILERIAPILVKGLIERCKNGKSCPLNIIACENYIRGSSQLKKYVMNLLPEPYFAWAETHVGFVDSTVDRIVPPSTADRSDPLEVTVESFSEWIVDKRQFLGTPPSISGMEMTGNLMAFIERKLFTLNTGHAITAYLGQLKGHTTIRDAILDPEIRTIVRGAMQESGAVLIKRYNFSTKKHTDYIEKILKRFENPYLKDDVIRVGRQPVRKLSPEDRLIKPVLGTLEYQLVNNNLLTGVAAALHFHSDDDPQARELAAMLSAKGVQATLAEISGLDINSDIVTAVEKIYNTL